MQDILEVNKVSKAYGGVVANEQVSLRVANGEIVGIIGPNGSGKTTLFNSIAGTHQIDDGSIAFLGKEISTYRIDKIARLGLLRTFQLTHIFGGLSAYENLLISVSNVDFTIANMFKKISDETKERADELLEFVGLSAKKYVLAGELSFGQQKLLEFAMALMNKPKLLLLDEPTAGVNPTLINGLIDRLIRANKELGITLLVIEHNMRVVMNLAERIYCLAHGKMLAEGLPKDIKKDKKVIDAYLGKE